MTEDNQINSLNYIEISGARENNLKNVDLVLPKNKLIVITGLSGSGKSSLAFDTIYAEGQRRYVESLSSYARQFLNLQDKPDVDTITGLLPTIAIEQKTTSKNQRSTIATITEIYDYMRLLFARVGIPHSPKTGLPIESQTSSQIIERIRALPVGMRVNLLAPVIKGKKGEHSREIMNLQRHGYTRLRINGEIYEIDDLPIIDKNKNNTIEVVIDRLVISEEIGNRLAASVENSLLLGKGVVNIEIVALPEGDAGTDEEENDFKEGQIIKMSSLFSCPESGFTIDEIEPRIFSFNSPYGACEHCGGLGKRLELDIQLIIADPNLSVLHGAIAPWSFIENKSEIGHYYMQVLSNVAEHYEFDIDAPWAKLPKKAKEILLYGSGDTKIKMQYEDRKIVYNVKKSFDGVINYLHRSGTKGKTIGSTELEKYQSLQKCSACKGYRLKKESLCIKVAEKNIGQINFMTIKEALDWFSNLSRKLSPKDKIIAERPLKEIIRRVSFLHNVGLGYLKLSRESNTLSGGESQRIRLASQIGSGLSGILYVLDEPSIGLHQSDNFKLLNTLKDLRNIGNTVIVVEHDHETIEEADYVVDVGPGAGVNGGHIVAVGTPKEIRENDDSLTGRYMSGKEFIPISINKREGHLNKFIEIINAKSNNLKNITVKFPLGKLICVTGLSGSGKSTLVIHTLCRAISQKFNRSTVPHGEFDEIKGLENIDKIIEINQTPIGRTPLSNAATYTGAFTHIREWFTMLPESKARGYKVGRFSFNTKGGRCEACSGDGVIKIEMNFFPDVYIKCEQCAGQRYNAETLEIKYKGKSISDVLEMNVDEAAEFFKSHSIIYEKMNAMQEVGLGYLNIGLAATKLSGGEAQRIKLSKELSKRSTGKTLYILDEPTTGLHMHDIKNLLKILHKLVDAGNTIIVIEHNVDVIKTADHVIDVGPEGGDKGGIIVAEGTPEEVAESENSITGKFLKKYIDITPKIDNSQHQERIN